MNKITTQKSIKIENLIYEIRDKYVMLDCDLANLYSIQTKRINEIVSRNTNKFSEKVSWILTDNEIAYLWSQNATANISNMSRSNSRVFSKEAVTILGSILRSENALNITIEIVNAFNNKENSRILQNVDIITNLIHMVREKQVILDYDLAFLYKVKTSELNKAMIRNKNRFPEDFCFRLTDEEYTNLKFQIGISSLKNDHGGRRINPVAYTEYGVSMMASLLNSEVAVKMSIKIIRSFVAMRHYIGSNELRLSNIETKVIEHDNRLLLLENTYDKFEEQSNKIYFEGQRYDAYSFLLDIINKSKKEIIIIDNYINKNLLDILSKTKKNIMIITNKYNNTDYEKYKSQYNNVLLKINNNIHDRYIIIDRNTLYHCGASFKDLGNKTFSINKIKDEDYIKSLINRYNL